MRLNAAQLLKESLGSSRVYSIDERLESQPGKEGVHSIQGQVSLLRTDKGLLVTSTLNGKAMVTCARCLSPFEYRLQLNIKEEFFATVDIVSGFALPRPDEPGIFTIDANHIIDLNEAVRQYSLMALPIKPLCHKDCAGLCPSCGKNLNEGPCHCKQGSAYASKFVLSAPRDR
jgi:uncharacterized protein